MDLSRIPFGLATLRAKVRPTILVQLWIERKLFACKEVAWSLIMLNIQAERKEIEDGLYVVEYDLRFWDLA